MDRSDEVRKADDAVGYIFYLAGSSSLCMDKAGI